MTDSVDVLVAGAGPAGLALGIDLQRRGVRCRVISAAPGGFEGSRAKGVQPRTLEVLDDLGVVDELAQHSALYPQLGLHLGPLTVPLRMIKRYAASSLEPHPNTLMVAQYDTDAVLRRRLVALGGRVEFNTRFLSFDADERGVVSTLETSDGTISRVHSRFLVGADGGSSTVRKVAGIAFTGTTDDSDRMLVADVTLDGLARDRWHIWWRLGGRFMALCPLPDGKFQLMLKLRPDEQADTAPAAIQERVRSFGTRATICAVSWASVWRPNIRLADRYRSGNILLVGDAAHVHPPTGGQGMNTGIQDSYNLGWKLGQVLAGAGDGLLDTYEAERRPIAARVLGLSSALYQSARAQPLAAMKRGDEERQLSLSYAGGPLAPDAAGRTRLLRAGDRVPDGRYTDASGRSTGFHAALRGPQFTLLALGSGADEAAARVRWPGAGASLTTLFVPELGEGPRTVLGAEAPTLLLVRPDGYLGAVEPVGQAGAIERLVAQVAPIA